MAKQIVSVGDLVLDLVLDVRLPARVDQHQMSPTLLFEPGGASTVILSARQMGLDVATLGTVGSDFQGQMLIDILESAGVNTSALEILPNSTTTTVVTLTDTQQGGHVFLGHYGEGKSIPLTFPAQAILDQSEAIFMPGYTSVEERLQPLIDGVFQYLRSHIVPFYFDVGPFLAQIPQQRVEQVLGLTTVLLLTEEEIPFVTQGQTDIHALRSLLDHYPDLLIVLKLGEQGCLMMSSTDADLRCGGYATDVVDTVGAGDAFAGAFMWAHLHDFSLEDCGKIANAMGSAMVEKAGAGRNVPTCERVQQILDKHSVGINLLC